MCIACVYLINHTIALSDIFLCSLMSCPLFFLLIYLIKVTKTWSGVVVQALIVALVRLRQVDLYEFETNLVYIVRYRTPRLHSETLSKNKQTNY